ncbi:hypothetical protein BZA05DRAFT_390733 [Tricharina praecox]|uniref:uncharacterized protein n=1 Tax=Tricharina praecox TaxID=43433 RepID=UPI00221F36FA|nr:uncharacterized protein BZA05DRAFT_390733 [Tricharina praecox]KAI5855172.1 hypothetical protein BZA05DRAFT_390733 [Tricharina praecox]
MKVGACVVIAREACRLHTPIIRISRQLWRIPPPPPPPPPHRCAVRPSGSHSSPLFRASPSIPYLPRMLPTDRTALAWGHIDTACGLPYYILPVACCLFPGIHQPSERASSEHPISTDLYSRDSSARARSRPPPSCGHPYPPCLLCQSVSLARWQDCCRVE